MKNVYLSLALLVSLLISCKELKAQRDTAFWFAVPEVSRSVGFYSTNLDTAIYLRITAYGQPSSVTIYKPANAAFAPITRMIAANQTATIKLTALKDSLECKPPDQVLTYGLKISATTPVSIYYEQACKLNPEIFTLKGRNALGTSFWIPGQDVLDNNSQYNPTPYNSFDIIATEDNTQVTITPKQNVTGHTAGVAYTITLNKGQTYSATAVTTLVSGHLHGSRVTSNKPIAITVKDDLLDSRPVWGQAHDLAGDQIVPVNVIGTEYIAVRGGLTAPYDKIFILGTQNGTTISRDGTPIGTVNAGAISEFYMNNPSTYIQTSSPVYVWQMSGLGAEVSTGILPPIVCTGSNAVAYVRSTTDPLYMMILVRNGGQNNFLFNGNATVLPGTSFTAVPGTGGQWVSAKFTISLTNLPVDSPVMVTNSSNLFHLGVVNGTSGGGGNFGYFSNFNLFSITASNIVTPCNQLQLHADSISGATYAWTGPNGYSSTAVNPVRNIITASDTGDYILVASYNGCTGTSVTHVSLAGAIGSPFRLDNDTAYCGAFSRVLSTGQAATTWSTGATGAQITVTAPGTYWAEISTPCTVYRDSIIISQLVNTPLNIGNDTTYCAAFSRVLSTAPRSALWSTGVTATQITVTAPGTYWAQTTNCYGTQRDSIVITRVLPPVVNIGNDTSYCTGTFSKTLSTAHLSALWSTGVTATQITVSAPGTYWAEVTNCAGTRRDSIQISVVANPTPVIGNDTTYCGPFSRVLSVAPLMVLWSTGVTASQITVNAPGTYWAQLTNCYGTQRDSIVIQQILAPVVNIGNDTIYCTNTFSKVLSTAPVTALWSTGANATQITVTAPGTYWAEVTNCAGTRRDSIKISVAPNPTLALANDTLYCGPFSRVLSVAPLTVLWSTGVTASQIAVNAPGTYWAQLTNCYGTQRDSIVIQQIPAPVVNIGNDTSYCTPFSRVLSTAPLAALWSTGVTAMQITVTDTGTYWAELTNCAGTVRDSIRFSYVANPALSIGNDTTYCSAFSRVLSSAPLTALWSTGVTATQIIVSGPGTYWAEITNCYGTQRDSVVISEIFPPSLNIGNDTTYCDNFSRILSAAPATVLWSTGVTATQITVTAPGLYWAEATNCAGTVRDSIAIAHDTLTAIHIGSDTSYCGPFSRVLSVAPLQALWSTGVTASQITVHTPGTIWVQYTNCHGTLTDSITLTQKPIPVVDLGPDDTLCIGDTKVIGTTGPGSTYQWNTGPTTATITISAAGVYIEQEELNGCRASDTVVISSVGYDAHRILPEDTTICDRDELIIRPAFGSSPVWQDGTTTSNYYVSQAGSYQVTVQTVCGVLADTIIVETRSCACRVLIPTAFSPNGDGNNDIYRVRYQCPAEDFHFVIYDRWGQKMFETTDIDEGWDGIYKNVPQPMEVYAWMMSYRDPYEKVTKSFSGNVTLMR